MSQICSKMAIFLFSSYFAAIFVTTATVKVIYQTFTLGDCSKKTNKKNLVKTICTFWPHGLIEGVGSKKQLFDKIQDNHAKRILHEWSFSPLNSGEITKTY